MGTDIGFVVEQRDAGGWRYVELPLVVVASGTHAGMNRCSRCLEAGMLEGTHFIHVANDAAECPGTWPGKRVGRAERDPWYAWRDETLFALLKPGVPRIDFLDEQHDERSPTLDPIAPSRGLPNDASRRAREEIDTLGSWGCSWLSLAELLQFDWNQTVFHAAWAPGERAAELQQWLDRARTQAPPDASSLIETELICPPDHVRVSWTQPLWQHIHPRFFATLLTWTRLVNGRIDDLRCIFAFTG